MNVKNEFDRMQNMINDNIYNLVFRFSVKDKRSIFLNTRSYPDVDHDSLLLNYGITVGEFSYSCILSDYIKREKKSNV